MSLVIEHLDVIEQLSSGRQRENEQVDVTVSYADDAFQLMEKNTPKKALIEARTGTLWGSGPRFFWYEIGSIPGLEPHQSPGLLQLVVMLPRSLKVPLRVVVQVVRGIRDHRQKQHRAGDVTGFFKARSV